MTPNVYVSSSYVRGSPYLTHYPAIRTLCAPIIARDVHGPRERRPRPHPLPGLLHDRPHTGRAVSSSDGKPLVVGAFDIYILFHIGQARANNMTDFPVTRFLSVFFTVVLLTNNTGIITAIWDPMNRGTSL
jgi:hypothetical protein